MSTNGTRPPKRLRIRVRSFELIGVRTFSPAYVYRGEGTFLRLGHPEVVQKELRLHRKLRDYGFPVPEIVGEGEAKGQSFYIEKSVGSFTMTDAFTQDWKERGRVSERNFSIFLEMTKRFAEAQLRSAPSNQMDDFRTGIRMDTAISELPGMKRRVTIAFERIKRRLSVFPVVLTHGDLNSSNTLPGGMIDFECAFNGPAGYDLIGSIYMTYLFPKTGDYENMRRYEFTEEQIGSYLKAIDDIYAKHDLPAVSRYQDDLLFAKLIWGMDGLSGLPKFRQWRFRLFEKTLRTYLDAEPIIPTLKTFS